MNLWFIFLTGLTSGGLSCLAVQGGFLASIIANQKEEEIHQKNAEVQKKLSAGSFDELDWLPVMLFLVAKLFAYVLLGFFLGWLGSKLELGEIVKLLFQSTAALFMLATAMNLLDVHPIFRYLVIQPPSFFQRLIRNTSKGKAFFTPLMLGLLTIFIPCGITQAMEITTISLGNPLQGAVIMGAFVLGTAPLFAIVGIATAKLSEAFRQTFLHMAALILIVLSLSSLNGVLVVLNSPLTFQTVTQPIVDIFSEVFSNPFTQTSTPPIIDGVQHVTIVVTNSGYSPNLIQVKVGIPVQLTVSTNHVYSCASSFLLNTFHVRMNLAPTDSQTVTFTPLQRGAYQFNCSMGMYRGVLQVI
ncbi:hypothetical protein C5B42_04335 [Candidatus Cerribacteria bacterium 'Amazon FNV 2010 28 9']|uniref:Urease accessory protein UreH-like transmembrane domain-containing protein n=1 Tax=Candidatus Cerribacteria bacterium 'Amazon FNV 2010 28 9' TaxID=2081795 RepID=A0A317JPA6_9BACT|nr:MAG: hypothetical protein C5B42_04335 [Candidatus Cerribacteria bacterium 'Amazon FNV 2010 28 9']